MCVCVRTRARVRAHAHACFGYEQVVCGVREAQLPACVFVRAHTCARMCAAARVCAALVLLVIVTSTSVGAHLHGGGCRHN